jgi:putative nucleotidyltransferase with HDIG domain
MMIKDEIHGTLEFDQLEERIIDTPAFQRLRRIRQMSVTNLVYPGANHTRFEHSLGTAHLAGVIARKVGLEDDEVRKVKLYGLLHDIGHTAFSHEGEDVLEKYVGSHEKLGESIIRNGEIADIISENYKPDEIIKLEKNNIITSDLGADRMDYLKRDAQNTGVAYGIIDIDRIVHTMGMEEGQLCIEKGGLEAAEYLLVARFVMFSTVYLHKTVRIATAMLYRAIEGTIEDGYSPKEFAFMDDESAMTVMLLHKGRKYADGLQNRKLYKEVYSLPRGSLEQAEELEKKMMGEYGCDVIVDYPHSFFKPADFKVRTSDGISSISNMSKLVQSLKKAEEERMRVLVLAEKKDAENIRQGTQIPQREQ